MDVIHQEWVEVLDGEGNRRMARAPWTNEAVSSRMPPRFASVSFDTFRAESESQREAARNVSAWIEAACDGEGPMLALVGKQGTGKSHLLWSAFRELSVGTTAALPYARPWYRLGDELRWGEGEKSGAAVRASLWAAHIVLLDEVRPTSGTNFDDTELAKFACHAYDNRVAVLLTTNYHPLAGVMGEAAASRFRQVLIDGPDHRQAA